MIEKISDTALSELIDTSGNLMGDEVVKKLKSPLIDLYIIYGRIGSGKSTLIEGLLNQSDELIYFPYDHIYDDAQESNIGLQKPIQNDEQHQILSGYWLRRLKILHEHLRARGIQGKIIADIPKFRCRQALMYLSTGQYQALFDGDISKEDVIRTRILPVVGDPRNENRVSIERAEVETYLTNSMTKVAELEGLAIKEQNRDALIYRNVIGLDWNRLMAVDRYRIYAELKSDFRRKIIPDPNQQPLLSQFRQLDLTDQMILRYDIVHMRQDIDAMGFDLSATPILINSRPVTSEYYELPKAA